MSNLNDYNTGPDYVLVNTPKYVGGYKCQDLIIKFTKKPLWLHRKMMQVFFGFKWIDE